MYANESVHMKMKLLFIQHKQIGLMSLIIMADSSDGGARGGGVSVLMLLKER